MGDILLMRQLNKWVNFWELELVELLNINTSCWLCLQFSHAWRAAPLTVATLTKNRYLIPEQITKVLQAADDIEKGRTLKVKPAVTCKDTQWEDKLEMMIPPLRVVHTQGDVCVCLMKPRLKLKAGLSDCTDTSPAAVWVCGDRAYHYLPEKGCSGCCYPALINVGTSVYLPKEEPMVEGRGKRSVNIMGLRQILGHHLEPT